ncbi:MAG: DUF4147 domain-containing protein [Candidatus Riflebacteria bacterium]|nr:DUF4147 domain-containing protein [Candidatus Riflebacteria bacterium]
MNLCSRVKKNRPIPAEEWRKFHADLLREISPEKITREAFLSLNLCGPFDLFCVGKNAVQMCEGLKTSEVAISRAIVISNASLEKDLEVEQRIAKVPQQSDFVPSNSQSSSEPSLKQECGSGGHLTALTSAFISAFNANQPCNVSFSPKTIFLKGSHPIPDNNSFRAGEKALKWLKKPEFSKEKFNQSTSEFPSERIHGNLTDGIVVPFAKSGHSLFSRKFGGVPSSLEVVSAQLLPGDGNISDTLVVCISGGSSAILAYPRFGISKKEKELVHSSLISSGLRIHKINTVRRHLSKIKGGGLFKVASKHYSRIFVLALSDVSGNSFSDIGSGPFSADPTTFEEAFEIARKVEDFPELPLAFLKEGVLGKHFETLKIADLSKRPKELLFEQIIADSNFTKEVAKKLLFDDPATAIDLDLTGQIDTFFETIVSSFRNLGNAVASVVSNGSSTQAPRADELQGEVLKNVSGGTLDERKPPPISSKEIRKIQPVYAQTLQTFTRDRWILGCGECEIKIPKGTKVGKGGRASHLVVNLALKLFESGKKFDVAVIATDGNDGNSNLGGGFLSNEDLEKIGIEKARASINCFDSASFLKKIDRHFSTDLRSANGSNFADLLILRIR